MKRSASHPQNPGKAKTGSKRASLKQLLLAAYRKHAHDPLTRMAARQCLG
jgi:hypothetical protein